MQLMCEQYNNEYDTQDTESQFSEYNDTSICDFYQDKLYSHQLKALSAMFANQRGIVASFCGTGKSRIMMEYIRIMFQNQNETKQHILIAFPSLILVDQFLENYAKELQIPIYVISSVSPYKITLDQFQSQYSLTLITYQSLKKISMLQHHFTIALFDEAHHICTKARINIISKFNAKLFYFTATPKQTKALDMYTIDDDEQEQSFTTGGLIFDYSFTEALHDQRVSDYQLVFRLYQNPDSGIMREIKMLDEIYKFAVQEKRRRIIIFTQYINITSKINKSACVNFKSICQNLRTVSAQLDMNERQQIFNWFQQEDDQIKIICNVSCIKEGVDLPCVDMVVFCDDKQSKVQIIQSIGRGTRNFNSKPDCLVLALVGYSKDIQELTDFENVNTQGKFKQVKFICNALKTVDMRIEQIMKGHPSSLKFIVSCADTHITHDRVQQLQTNLITHLNGEFKWNETFKKCQEFTLQYSKYPSQTFTNPDENRLGRWISRQKQALNGKSDSKMTDERKRLLEEYLKDFKNADEIWNETFKKCQEFTLQHSKYPSNSSKNIDEKRLGSWLSDQKKTLNGTRKCRVIDERRRLLEEYLKNFKNADEIWNETFKKCQEFNLQHSKYPSNTSKNIDEKRLCSWIFSQRKALNGKGTYKMTDERRRLLEEYLKDFKNADEIWNETFKKCQEFTLQHSKYPSQKSKNSDEKRLGRWLSDQRQSLNDKGYITDERRRLLEEYLKDFKNADEIWDETFKKCQEFTLQHGKYPTDLDEKQLCKWISHQKQALNGKGNYKMTDERRRLLEEYLKDFKNADEIWNETFKKCQEFTLQHSRYPNKRSINPDEKRLGQWICAQKSALNGKGYITDERRKLLEEYLPHKNQVKKTMKCDVNPKKQTSTNHQSQYNTIPHKSQLSELHKQYKVMNSQTLHNEFNQDPELWYKYHQISEQNESKFAEQDGLPYKRVIKYLQDMRFKRKRLVVDLGCGMNRIYKELQNDSRFEFKSFDHIAVDETVQQCDISQLPIEDCSVNICILCLALWGSNNREYIREAYRVLEFDGLLLIVEPTKRIQRQDESLIQECEQMGFECKYISQDKFSFIQMKKQ